MRENSLKRLLQRGGTAVNAWLSIPATYSAEGAAWQGFDSVTIDLQHGMIGFESAIPMFQAISTSAAVPLARVPQNDPAQMMRLLDAGAYGVICPMISTAEEAARFAGACRYPPRGTRSYGPARGLLYGGADYVDHADETILAIAMIETVEGVENVDAILGVAEVDMIFIGPNDMALAHGEQPGPEAARAEAAIAHVLERAHHAGKTAGIYCSDGAVARMRAEQGFDLVTPGSDFTAMTRGLRAAVATVRGEGAAPAPSGGY